MTGTTALTVSVPLPGIAALPSFLTIGAPAVATPVQPGMPGAVPSLANFIDLMIGKAVAPKAKLPVTERHNDAAPGNCLPEKAKSTVDPALAWLFSAPPIASPVAAAPMVEANVPGDLSVTKAASDPTVTPNMPVIGPVAPIVEEPASVAIAPDVTPAVPIDAKMAVDPRIAIVPEAPAFVVTPVELQVAAPVDPKVAPPVALLDLVGPQIAPTIDSPEAVAIEITPAPVAAVRKPVARPTIDPIVQPIIGPKVDRPVDPVEIADITPTLREIAPKPQPIRIALPLAQPVTPATIAPLLASAPQPALFALATLRERARDDEARPLSAAATASILLQPTDAAALIAKPGEIQRQALDMGRQDWPQKMIDRIEALRDDANANDTSIRLKPEALGRIDIAVKSHVDGAVSVRFTAEQSTTRALIADAQPQLQAAAEARGIRLSGTSVDLGGSGNAPERQQPRFEPKTNTSNQRAASGDDSEAVDDGRIA